MRDIFYIAHLGVRYEIYTLALPFDLSCQSGIYGTAQFKLEARVQLTRVYFVAPLEYFSKSCVSVDNCTRILRAIHARVTLPNMLAYIRARTFT